MYLSIDQHPFISVFTDLPTVSVSIHLSTYIYVYLPIYQKINQPIQISIIYLLGYWLSLCPRAPLGRWCCLGWKVYLQSDTWRHLGYLYHVASCLTFTFLGPVTVHRTSQYQEVKVRLAYHFRLLFLSFSLCCQLSSLPYAFFSLLVYSQVSFFFPFFFLFFIIGFLCFPSFLFFLTVIFFLLHFILYFLRIHSPCHVLDYFIFFLLFFFLWRLVDVVMSKYMFFFSELSYFFYLIKSLFTFAYSSQISSFLDPILLCCGDIFKFSC